MAKWKLCRHLFGQEIYEFKEGDDVTIGRGIYNTITLSSLNISRKHCVIKANKDDVTITDLQSANGIFIGQKKITPNRPVTIYDNDIIGLGWIPGAPVIKIEDADKFVFKLVKVSNPPSITDRIQFELENCTGPHSKLQTKSQSPSTSKLSLKRKTGHEQSLEFSTSIKNEHEGINNSITYSSFNNFDSSNNLKDHCKKLKLSSDFDCIQELPGIKVDEQPVITIEEQPVITIEEQPIITIKEHPLITIEEQPIITIEEQPIITIKKHSIITNKEQPLSTIEEQPVITIEEQPIITIDDEDLEHQAFNIKQECFDDDEPEIISSDSESEHSLTWFGRLSQNSSIMQEVCHENNSYSQLDDDNIENISDQEEVYLTDLIIIPPAPEENNIFVVRDESEDFINQNVKNIDELDASGENNACPLKNTDDQNRICFKISQDNLDKVSSETTTNHVPKKTQLIDPVPHSKRKSISFDSKDSKKKKCTEQKLKEYSCKIKITDAQKEERSKKLRELVSKTKEDKKDVSNTNNKIPVNAKNTPSSNRGKFLSQTTSKPTRKKIMQSNQHDTLSKSLENDHTINEQDTIQCKPDTKKAQTSIDKSDQFKGTCETSSSIKSDYTKELHSSSRQQGSEVSNSNHLQTHYQTSLQTEQSDPNKIKGILKHVKENNFSEIKQKRTVRFSKIQPEPLEFEIEPGNQLKNLSVANKPDTWYNLPVFALEKLNLMKILGWNPQWISQQNLLKNPPPILKHDNTPIAIPHYFNSHSEYVKLIEDLLFMEIWDCLTQGYIRTTNDNYLKMTVEYVPMICPEATINSNRKQPKLFNLCVNVSLPKFQAKYAPREGEILLIKFEENTRFSFVQKVRSCTPMPPSNVNSLFTISLQTSSTKISTLQRGSVIYGKSLAYINNELRLFEAMEYLSKSQLSEIILNPKPWHFRRSETDYTHQLASQWTAKLNESQKNAVICSVSAALGKRAWIHMVQGPPGTGKSRVICSMVMEYFYDAASKKQKHRGKILICATSNAAVDELVIRLLDIRQTLPQLERLNIVRVGRAEAMQERARDVSSQALAQRDAARQAQHQQQQQQQQQQQHQQHSHLAPHDLAAEIAILEAKKNMWQSEASITQDKAREAYCKNQIELNLKKIAMFRGGGGGRGGAGEAASASALAAAEQRLVEGADVVLTTLASAHGHKMRRLRGKIALCIVDEAGQAIEPETLIPLMLDVKCLSLIGDPQQLPGYLCSQQAKELGLNKSLFSRLSSCAETWGEAGPVVMLDHQYRMHPHIVDYPNRAFYGDKIHTVAPPPLHLNIAPYFVLGIASGDRAQGGGAIEVEAWGALRVALAARSRLPRGRSLALVTPYAAQRDLLRRLLNHLHQLHPSQQELGVEVNTVDSFQGQERDVVVVSLARSRGLGFLAEAGRMNVLLTRARHALLLCLNPLALQGNAQQQPTLWSTLIEDARSRNMYGMLPMKFCHPLTREAINHDEILQYLSSSNPSTSRRNRSHSRHRRDPRRSSVSRAPPP